MKEKIGQVKTWIKEHKKRSAVIATAIVLILGAAGLGIMGVNNVNANTSADKKISTETVKKDIDETLTKVSDADKKEENETITDEDSTKNSDTIKTEEKDTTDIQQSDNQQSDNASVTTSNIDNSGASSSGASSESGGNTQTYIPPSEPVQQDPPAHVHSWEQKYKDEKVWIDTSGYVPKPIMRCGICNEDITDNPGKHLEAHALAGEGVGNAYSDVTQVWESSGYWDTQSVPDGYKCSCGATK